MAVMNFTAPLCILLFSVLSQYYWPTFPQNSSRLPGFGLNATLASEYSIKAGTEAYIGLRIAGNRRAILDSNHSASSKTLFLLLLLHGDVQTNPGPNWKYPCAMCDKPVKANQRGIQCDNCDMWLHTKCCSVSDSEYNLLANSSSSWICPGCCLPNFSESFFENPTAVHLSNSFSSLSESSQTPAEDAPEDHSTKTPVRRRQNKPKLKIYNINFQSIKNKVTELQAFLDTEKPDIIIGTETWLNSSVKNCELFPPTYSVFRKDRDDGFGGVLIAVKDQTCQELDDLDSNCESIWVKVTINPRRYAYVGAFYNPGSLSEPLDELDKSLSKLQKKSGNALVYLGGDFNLGGDISWETNSIIQGSRNSTACQKLLEMCFTYNLEQVVQDATRHDKILGLFFTSNSTLINSVKVTPGFGDHGMVKVEACISPKASRQTRRSVFLYPKGNFTDFKLELLNFSKTFLNSFYERSVDENWNTIKTKLLALMTKYIPCKLTSSRHSLPWFTRDLRKLNRKVQRLYNVQKCTNLEHDKAKYRQIRKVYKKKLNHSYWDYINKLLDASLSEQPKKFWRFVKAKRQDNIGVHPLQCNNVTVSDSLGKANALNNHFHSVFTQENSGHMPKLDSNLSCPAIDQIIISSTGVQKILDSLQVSKASGPDNLPARILKELSFELAPILSHLFQQSLDQGELPGDWKTANVVPVFKKGNKSVPGNYRPISLTSITCKVFEHLICHHIWKHLEKYNTLTDFQHGFRKHRNCETQLIVTLHDLASAVNERKQVDAFILDFSKAFDKVPHERLLYKLSHYGIKGNMLAWIRGFLTQRTQRVTLEGASSDLCDVTSGVPQGTVLGPLLFLLYINDLPTCISSTIRLFADDCLLYRTISDSNDCTHLQGDLDALSQWENDWQMSFNVGKCHTICFSTKHVTNPGISYKLNNHPLDRVHHHSYLGVILSEDLKWANHISQVTTSAKQTLGVIRRNFRHTSVDCKSRLYSSLVRPKIEYANSAWYPYLEKDKYQLDMIQRTAARICLNNYSREPGSVTGMLKDLEWPSLEGRRRLSRLTMFHNICHGNIDIDKDLYLTPVSRHTRHGHSKSYHRPHSNCNQHSNSFFPWSIKHWNMLPDNIVNISNPNVFKTAVRDHFIKMGEWY